MDTRLTIEQILIGLRNSGLWNIRSDIMIPNLSYGLLPYEADFVVISKAGYLTEVEIKRSWQDFKADFKKEHKHDADQVYYFYYCVPESIVDKVVDYFKTQYGSGWCPALLKFTEKGQVSRVLVKDETSGRYRSVGTQYNEGYHRKLFLEEQLTVARLGQLRYWSLLEKTNKV